MHRQRLVTGQSSLDTELLICCWRNAETQPAPGTAHVIITTDVSTSQSQHILVVRSKETKCIQILFKWENKK